MAEGAAGAAAASAGGRQASAATLVQSVWRGYTDRRKLSDLMEDLVAESLLNYDHGTAVATLTSSGRELITPAP